MYDTDNIFEQVHRIYTAASLNNTIVPRELTNMANPAIFTNHTAEWSFWQPNEWKVTSLFDVINHQVYQIDVINYKTGVHDRWFDLTHKTDYESNCFERQIDPTRGENGMPLYTHSTPSNLLSMAQDLVEGITYNDDGTVNIPIDMSDDEFLMVARAAHELDITINEYMEKAVTEAIEREKNINKLHNDWLV